MHKFRKFVTIYLSLILTTLIGCSTTSKEKIENSAPISRTELFMGTVVKITLYDNADSKILDKAFDRIKEIENLVSINKTNTELEKVNSHSGKKPISVSQTTFDIVEKGLEYSKISNGDFDITIGPLVKLWSIGLPEAKVPTNEELLKTLPLINYNNVELNKETKSIFLKESNMIIDLGAIAKGYAADEVVKILKENEVNSALIDLGGNLYCMGLKPSGSKWKIGIQNPFNNRGDIIGTIYVDNKTIVTSGIYERFIEKDDIKYHHLLNPSTGYPFENELAGVSIITDNSIDADALSTVIFAKGLEEGLALVNSLNNVEAIFITKDKKVYTSAGVTDDFSITNTDFTLNKINS